MRERKTASKQKAKSESAEQIGKLELCLFSLLPYSEKREDIGSQINLKKKMKKKCCLHVTILYTYLPTKVDTGRVKTVVNDRCLCYEV